MATVEAQTAALEASHRRWIEEKAQWLESEHARRIETMNMEKQRLMDMQRIHAKTRERRLQQIEIMEKNASDALNQTSQLLQAEHERYAAEWTLLKEKQTQHIVAYKEEEELRTLEAASKNRVKKLMDERAREERLQEWRSNFFAQCRQQEIADLTVFDAWKAEDESMMRAQEQQQAEEVERRQMEQEQQLFKEWQTRIKEHQMEKQRQMQILATERQLRVQEQAQAMRRKKQSVIHEDEKENDDEWRRQYSIHDEDNNNNNDKIGEATEIMAMNQPQRQYQRSCDEKQYRVHAQGATSASVAQTTAETWRMGATPSMALSSSSLSLPPPSSFTNAQLRTGPVDTESVAAGRHNGMRDENEDSAKGGLVASCHEHQNDKDNHVTWQAKATSSRRSKHSSLSSLSSEKRLQRALDEISSSSSSNGSNGSSHLQPRQRRDLSALERELRMAFSDDDDNCSNVESDNESLEQRPLSELDLDHVMLDVDNELFSDSSRSSSHHSDRHVTRRTVATPTTTKEEQPRRILPINQYPKTQPVRTNNDAPNARTTEMKVVTGQALQEQKLPAPIAKAPPSRDLAEALSTVQPQPRHSYCPVTLETPPLPPRSSSREPVAIMTASSGESLHETVMPPQGHESSNIDTSIIIPATDERQRLASVPTATTAAAMATALKPMDVSSSSSLPPPLVKMVNMHLHDTDQDTKEAEMDIATVTSETTKKLRHLQRKLSSMQFLPEDHAKKHGWRQEGGRDKGESREMEVSRGGGGLQIPPRTRDEEHEQLMARAKELLEQHRASQNRQKQLA